MGWPERAPLTQLRRVSLGTGHGQDSESGPTLLSGHLMGLQGWGRKLLDTENSFPQREHSPHLRQRVLLILHSSSASWLHWGAGCTLWDFLGQEGTGTTPSRDLPCPAELVGVGGSSVPDSSASWCPTPDRQDTCRGPGAGQKAHFCCFSSTCSGLPTCRLGHCCAN